MLCWDVMLSSSISCNDSKEQLKLPSLMNNSSSKSSTDALSCGEIYSSTYYDHTGPTNHWSAVLLNYLVRSRLRPSSARHLQLSTLTETKAARTTWNKTEIKLNNYNGYFTRTRTTMFYFGFISHVRAAVFFNVSNKTLKQLWNADTFCFKFYFSFILHVRAPEVKLFERL